MKYNRLGKAGLAVSALSFGSWVTFAQQADEHICEDCMHLAYNSGINFFDNAEAYAQGESEKLMGRILKKSHWPRDTYVVSSKVFWGGDKPNQKGLSAKHVFEACNSALQRLGVEYLDLFFCHRPDEHTPIEETVRAMHNLILQGKVLYWGTSEWSAQEIMQAYTVARQYNLTPPTMEQPQYNMFHRERVEKEYRRLYQEIGLGTTIWSPLASGLLTGKYNDGVAPKGSRAAIGIDFLKEHLIGPSAKPKIEQIKKLMTIAKKLDCTMAQCALAWCLKNKNVSTVITGATKLEQLAENLKALDVAESITDEIMDEFDGVLNNKPEISFF